MSALCTASTVYPSRCPLNHRIWQKFVTVNELLLAVRFPRSGGDEEVLADHSIGQVLTASRQGKLGVGRGKAERLSATPLAMRSDQSSPFRYRVPSLRWLRVVSFMSH